MNTRISTNEIVDIYVAMKKEMHTDQATPFFLFNQDFQIIWRNKISRNKFHKFTCLNDFLPFLKDATLEKIIMELSDWQKITVELHEDFPGGFTKFHFYKGPHQCDGRIFECQLFKGEPQPISVEAATKYKTFIQTICNEARPDLAELETKNHLSTPSIMNLKQSFLELERLSEMQEEYAKLDQGTVPHKIRLIDLSAYLTSILEFTRGLLGKAGIDLCSYTPTESILVYTEPEYILRTLAQLISNAAQFREGDSAITIRCEAHDVAMDISVENKGAIPEIVRPTLFQPNFSYHYDGDIGNGLGLFIARGYARFMGGDIFVEERDHTTIFKLSLPLHRDFEPEQNIQSQLCLLLSDIPGGEQFVSSLNCYSKTPPNSETRK